MRWILASVITALLWGSYSIFGERATRIHGEKVSFVFEVFGMILVAAVVMGLLTSLGAFMLLYALRLAPSVHQVPIVVVIAGFYPVVTAILSYFSLGLDCLQFSGWEFFFPE